jgi:hypothetical protein
MHVHVGSNATGGTEDRTNRRPRFRQGTPYEDRELYLGVGGRRPFVALCPMDAHREMEPCLTTLRFGELDVELRFNARHLPEWRRILEDSTALLERLPASAP